MNREEIRVAHAIWSHETFGDVGPVGPLKHLAQEALEAAENPNDLSEWADIQFLIWDAQRRAGVTDEQLTQAMIAKLEENKKRSWGTVKDGEPVNHVDAGWIDWYGGKCPVDPGLIVSVKYRNGMIKDPVRADSYLWTHGFYNILATTGSDIVAYKIEGGWIDWPGGKCPIPGWQDVEVRFRDGDKESRKAEYYRWDDSGSFDDIVAYRLVM